MALMALKRRFPRPAMALVALVPAALAAPPSTPLDRSADVSDSCGGATTAPNASWVGAYFSMTERRASSLRECAEWCGNEGMVPACIGSAEEITFLAALVPEDDWAMIGHYWEETKGTLAGGRARCVAGDTSDFGNWVEGEPTNSYQGFPEACTVVTGKGGWLDVPCVAPPRSWPVLRTWRCLCEGPASSAESFEQDLRVIEAPVAAQMLVVESRAAAVCRVCVLLFALHALLVLGSHLRMRRRLSDADDLIKHVGLSSSKAQKARVLRAAYVAGEQRRLLVSSMMRLIGAALFVLGLVPTMLHASGNTIDFAVGCNGFWLVLWPPGLSFLLLSLLPTDERVIRTVAGFSVALLLGVAVAFGLVRPAWVALFGAPSGVDKLALGSPIWDALALGLPQCFAGTMAAAGLWPVLRSMPPRQGLRRLWLAGRFCQYANGGVGLAFSLGWLWTSPSAVHEPNCIAHLIYGATTVAIAKMSTPANRSRMRRWMTAVSIGLTDLAADNVSLADLAAEGSGGRARARRSSRTSVVSSLGGESDDQFLPAPDESRPLADLSSRTPLDRVMTALRAGDDERDEHWDWEEADWDAAMMGDAGGGYWSFVESMRTEHQSKLLRVDEMRRSTRHRGPGSRVASSESSM
eukprot:Transcript_25064.p1 GENE.Transcript_25064~~Transcript_25064.p1  ORF type:complete len:636 (+),score=46.67 Transcript_25064:56-1963(+)